MGVPYREVIERMKLHGKLKNDSAVARALGVTPQALSNYKKRGEMPSNLAIKFAQAYKISVDWLITGEGRCKINEKVEGFSPQEIEYIGKLIKILRGRSEGPIIGAMKQTLDALYSASESMNDNNTESIIEKKVPHDSTAQK